MRRIVEWLAPSDLAARELQRDQMVMAIKAEQSGSLASGFAFLGIAIIMLQWHSLALVSAWMMAVLAASAIAYRTNAHILRNQQDLTRLRQLAFIHLASNVIIIGTIAATAPVFWVAGEATNHMLLLLVLFISAAVGTAYSAPFGPSCAVNAILVIASATMCFIEGGPTYMIMGAICFALAALLLGVGIQIHANAREMLSLRIGERALVGQLREANQAKATFLASMSHELRTPLNAIIGFSDIMRHELIGPLGGQAYKGYANDIHSSGGHLLALIQDILDLSKIEAGKLELREIEYNLRQLVDEAVRLLAVRAQEGGVSVVSRIGHGIRVHADLTAMRQVALNVIGNAIKFTPAGGQVEITSRLMPDGSAALVVRDTGYGIPAEEQDQLFEAFTQARHDLAVKERGTGLGLAIVRKLMRAHGGEAWLESELGVGTTVYLTLPADRIVEAESRRAA